MSSARDETSAPTISVNRRSLTRAVSSAPPPQPRSSTRAASTSASAASTASRRCSASGALRATGSSASSSVGRRPVDRPSCSSARGRRTPAGAPGSAGRSAPSPGGRPASPSPERSSFSISSGRDPVVLGVVQDRQQHVQVVERVGEPERAGQASDRRSGCRRRCCRLAAGSGSAVTCQPSGANRRLARSAVPRSTGTRISSGIALGGQLRAVLRDAAQGAAEDLGERGGEQAGGRVRAVVDVLAQRRTSRRWARSRCGSTSSSSAAVHRSSVASGYITYAVPVGTSNECTLSGCLTSR